MRFFAQVAMTACLALLVSGAQVEAADQPPVRIGVLNDMAGPFADLGGPGSVIAAEMAVSDFGGNVLGRKIEILSANHQNKPDVGVGLANKWYDVDGVSMIVDILNSAVALAVEDAARQRNRILIGTVIGAPAFTGARCSPTAVGWTLDTYALSNSLADYLVKKGLDSWYFLTVDYAFGHALEADATAAIEHAGGKVVGSARYPLNTSDFSSLLLRAQTSGAKVVAFANAGADLVNGMKQAREFGLDKSQKLVALDAYITDIHSLGLDSAQGLVINNAWYWNRNDKTREWGKRFMKRHGAAPTQDQASVYSAVSHYLKAVAAANTLDAPAVMAKMRELPVNDMFTSGGKVRIDGRMEHDMYLMRVKTPQQSKEPWDYLDQVDVIPGSRAFRSLAEGGCPLAKGPAKTQTKTQ